jgi:hypothetical protein
MPSTVHFAPSLGAGSLLIAKSMVNTQTTGLVEVSVDYICRSADLPTQVAKFFLDAPPPIFPSKTISTSSLAQGKLFMVNYGVTDQYGIATINARYAGVTARAIKPFATFEYSNFAVSLPVYANLAGVFGSQKFIGSLEFDNDFSANDVLRVSMRGQAEVVKYTFATLDAESGVPTSLPPRPTDDKAFAKLELVPDGIRIADRTGRYGDILTPAVPNEKLIPFENDPPPAPPPEPLPTVSADAVASYLLVANNYPAGFQFRDITLEQWRERGVQPRIYWNIARQTEAVTPSVYIREITYAPFVFGI